MKGGEIRKEKESLEASRIKRKVKCLESSGQLGLFEGERKSLRKQSDRKKIRGATFCKPSAKRLLVGDEPLEDYLRRIGDRSIALRSLLEEMDWKELEEKYEEQGRPAYHPMCMVGLILYGIGEGKSSLRELERLAQKDAGCWYVTGGIMPDHSGIGRFIQNHSETLTDSLFEQWTREILKRAGSRSELASGDGTIVQAAASKYRRLKREAAEQQAEEARARQQRAPEDEKLTREAERAELAAEAARQREQVRRQNRTSVETVRVSATEPEAVLQQVKEKMTAFAYKPSVVANEDRIILAKAVHPSSETAVLAEMVQVSKEVAPELESLLLDAAYFQARIFEECSKAGIKEVLCPEGRPQGKQWEKARKDGLFHKNQFEYQAEDDCYICPAGQRLTPFGQGTDRGLAYTRYGKGPCQSCFLRSRCTRDRKRGRTIKRYEGDEAKEEMRRRMSQPEHRQRYQRRKTMVEPVFSELKLKQRLTRFRRSGLKNVRTELSLHAMAHNFRRYLSIMGPVGAFLSLCHAIFQLWTQVKPQNCASGKLSSDYLLHHTETTAGQNRCRFSQAA